MQRLRDLPEGDGRLRLQVPFHDRRSSVGQRRFHQVHDQREVGRALREKVGDGQLTELDVDDAGQQVRDGSRDRVAATGRAEGAFRQGRLDLDLTSREPARLDAVRDGVLVLARLHELLTDRLVGGRVLALVAAGLFDVAAGRLQEVLALLVDELQRLDLFGPLLDVGLDTFQGRLLLGHGQPVVLDGLQTLLRQLPDLVLGVIQCGHVIPSLLRSCCRW